MSCPPRRKFWSKRVLLTVVVIIVLTVAGVTVYVAYQGLGCGNALVGCGPIPYPAIQSARAAVNSTSYGICQTTSTSTVAICSIFMISGVSGNVSLNAFDKNQQSWQGGTRGQFLVYSSDAQFINFTTLPSCAYTSAPRFDSPSCQMGIQAQTFQFNFEMSPNYVAPPSSAARQPSSITVVIYQSCCWP